MINMNAVCTSTTEIPILAILFPRRQSAISGCSLFYVSLQ